MNDKEPPIEQCDVLDKEALAKYRAKRSGWRRWLNDDPQHALWAQLQSMLIEDVTFRTLAAAAESDPEGAIHSPLIARGLLQGYAASQGLVIRRQVDRTRGVISLWRLVQEIKENLGLFTREIYVGGDGVPYDPAAAEQEFHRLPSPAGKSWAPAAGPAAFVPSLLRHRAFDELSGTAQETRKRTQRLSKRVIATVEGWLAAREVEDVVVWSNMCVAHAADQASNPGVDLTSLAPTFAKIAAAQRHLVRAAEAVSAHLLQGPMHANIVPVAQYNQFARLERMVNSQAVALARQRWDELTAERDRWTANVFDALVGKPG